MKNSKTTKKKWEEKMKKKEPLLAVESCKKLRDSMKKERRKSFVREENEKESEDRRCGTRIQMER